MLSMLSIEKQRPNFASSLKYPIPMTLHIKLWPFALILMAFVSCLQPDDPNELLPDTQSPALESNQMTWEWTELYLSIERDLAGFRPAPTARALAYIHMGGFETVVPGSSKYRSLGYVISGFPNITLDHPPTQIDWNIALNAYYARTFRFFLFNANQQQVFEIEKLESNQLELLGQNVSEGVTKSSIAWGQKVANAIINYAETDREGATQSRVVRPTDYFPPSGDGLWTPTLPDLGGAMFPYWGKVRTFAAGTSDLLSPPPPYVYDTDSGSDYYKDNLEVNTKVSNMTTENRWIAEFWSDDLTGLTFSPPARIFAIANQVIQADQMNMEETIHMYCKLGIAINDAAVGAWKSKYVYNTERPETYIHKFINPDFKSILGEAIGVPGINPSFPGYPSGHSTFAGVSEKIYDQFFGAQYDFTDHCHFGRTEFNGYPRTYSTWKQMAEENAFSRIPLGVHVRMDCTEGLRLGRNIAQKALDLQLTK
jgi:hypothetical protein